MTVLERKVQKGQARPLDNAVSHFDEVRSRVLESFADQLAPGDRLPSDKQLAQQLGVSNVTIGRVMHDLQRVGVVHRVPGKGTFLKSESASPGDRNGAPALNHEPIATTAAAFTPETRSAPAPLSAAGTFTWIITSFHPGDIGKSIQGWAVRTASRIERELQSAGGRTLLTNTEPYKRPVHPMELVDRLGPEKTGVVLVPSARIEADCPELVSLLLNVDGSSPRWPVVHMPFGIADLPFDAVNFDEERGIYAAVAHLWELGHREIAYVLPSQAWCLKYPWLQKRVRAFNRAMMSLSHRQSAGHVIYGDLDNPLQDDQWVPSGQTVGRLLLTKPELSGITGVMAANDAMAGEIIDTWRLAGRRVPEDLSVVGYDDNAWGSSLGLTTIHVPIEEMGEQAAQLILRRLNGTEISPRLEVSLQPTLVARETTAPPHS